MAGVLCSMVGASFQVAAVAEILRSKKSIIAIGNAQVDTAQSKFGVASAAFDGTDDALGIEDTSWFNFGAGDFTVECWFRYADGSAYPALVTTWSETASTRNFFLGIEKSTGKPVFFFVNSAGTINTSMVSSTAISTNTWYHLAICGNSTNFKLYLNGTEVSSLARQTLRAPQNSFRIGNTSDLAQDYAGWIDEVRVSNVVRYTSNFTVPTAPFSNDDNTLLLIHADGTDATTFFEDDNGVTAIRSATTLTPVGNAQLDTAQYKFGNSSYLGDGTGDYLRIDNTSKFAYGSSDFTIEFWIRFNSTATQIIWDQRPAGLSTTQTTIYFNNSTLKYFTNAGDRIISSTLSTGTWYHVAVCRSGTSTRMFINGTQAGSTYTDTTVYTTGTPITLGADSDSLGNNSVNGWIDEVRVSKVAHYTANFTAPTAPFQNDANTLLLLHMDGADASTTFVDDVTGRSAKGVTAVGNAQIDTGQNKFGGASAQFDGTGDYLQLNDAGFQIGNSDFTIEGWVRSTATANQGVFHLASTLFPAGTTGIALAIRTDNANWVLYASGGIATSTSVTAATNTWYHFAVVKTAGNTKLYINGVEAASRADTTNYNNVDDLAIGGYYSTSFLLTGHIDEFRISNTARYTAAFTAPTAPHINDANTLLLLHMDGTDTSTVFRDDNGYFTANRKQKHISYYGNAQIDTAQSKFGGSSALFDGTGDYLLADTNATFGTGDFTIECWIRTNANAATNYYVFDARSGANLAVIQNQNNINVFTGGSILAGPTISTGVWYHIALVRSNGTATFYVDGVGYQQHSLTTNFSECDFFIGSRFSATEFFNGWIDEFRVSNVARYTANFTPSTTAFQDDANTLLLLHMDGVDAATTFIDDVGGRSAKGIQAFGNAQIDTAQSKFGGTSAQFDGTGDYLGVFPAIDFKRNSGSDPFTIEAWVYQTAAGGGILSDSYTGGSDNVTIAFGTYAISGSDILAGRRPFLGTFNGSSWSYVISSSDIPLNTWTHIAGVFTGSTTKLYVNGTEVASGGPSSWNTNTPGNIYIGRRWDSFQSEWWNGWIDELRFSNTVRYTGNFTPSTTPFQNDANTLLLLHMDGTDASTVFIDDNGQAPKTA